MVNAILQPLYPRERDQVPIALETGRVGCKLRTVQTVASRSTDCNNQTNWKDSG